MNDYLKCVNLQFLYPNDKIAFRRQNLDFENVIFLPEHN